MESLPLHPKIIHLPMALAVLMPMISVSLLVAWWRGWLARRVWWLSVGLQAVLLASSVAALQTGEAEEERAEQVVAEQYIEAHEEAAHVFTIAAAAVLALMALAAFLPGNRAGLGVAGAAAAASVVVLMLGVRVGEAGGRLVYQHGAGVVRAPERASGNAPREPAAPTRGNRHDDDD